MGRMTSPLRTLVTSLSIATVILLSGCTVKFYYNQLDWLVPWYVDDYVSLTSKQEDLLQEHLDEYLDWHRKEQLPVYADFLEWAASASEDGFDGGEIQHLQERINYFVATMFTRLAPALVDLFQSLSDEQVDELFSNFANENLEYSEERIDISERKNREERAEELVELVERWTGDLNAPQLEYIENWSSQYKIMSADFLDSRKQWQQELRLILQQRDDRDYLQTALLDLFSRRYSRRSAEYQEKFEFNEELLRSLYVKLDQSLSSRQRQSLVTEFSSLADDLRYLASQGYAGHTDSTL